MANPCEQGVEIWRQFKKLKFGSDLLMDRGLLKRFETESRIEIFLKKLILDQICNFPMNLL